MLVLLTVTTPAVHAQPLRVGTSGDYAPFSVRSAEGTLSGFDVAVATRLAKDLGRPVEFVPFRWPELAARLDAGAFDVAMSGVTVRPERAIRGRFSRPYASTGAVAVIRRRDRSRFRSITDLDRAGVRIAVNHGGHLEQVARARFAHAQLEPVADNARLPVLLRDRSADAVISEALEARSWRDRPFHVIGPFTHDSKAYLVPVRASALIPQIDAWLVAREADGWLNEQRQRWLGPSAVRTDGEACFDALVAAITLRLQLMPFVAAVKRAAHLPIEDPGQEARVLDRVRASAAATGLRPDDVAALFRVQMDIAKAVEDATPQASAPAATLDELRAAIAAVSDQLIAELVHCRTWLATKQLHDQRARAVSDGLTAPGVPPEAAQQLLQALEAVGRRGPYEPQ